MARTKNTATADEFDFANVEVADSTMPERRTREEKPNPLLPQVRMSLDSGTAKVLPRIPADAVKAATNFLRRAAAKLDCGLELRTVDNGDGTAAVHFQATREKRERKYTIDEVREWAREQGYGEDVLVPKCSKEVIDEYRVAHNMRPHPSRAKA